MWLNEIVSYGYYYNLVRNWLDVGVELGMLMGGWK